ncbi:MAG: DMT family transporter [Acetilactobacillus jinshanensis]
MNQQKSQDVKKGIFWSATASCLWGVSGNLMQFVSQNEAVSTQWFMSFRTLFAGVLLLIIGFFQVGKHVLDPLKKKNWKRLIIYSIFGIGMNMSTFYICIQSGNAAMATILQYLAPLFIALYTFVFKRQKPLKGDMIAFAVALIGVFLSVTRGNLDQLSIPLFSIIFGLLSAVSAGVYYAEPKPLMKDNSPIVILGWGTLITSIFSNLYSPVWKDVPKLTARLILGVTGVILIGTIIAFSCMLYSLRFASSQVSSIVDAIEPVATFIISIIFFHTSFNWVEIVGFVLVITSVYILEWFHHKTTNQDAKEIE